MVFCNTRRNVDLLAKNLKRYEIDALAIHGGLAQNKRSNIMKDFHSNKVQVLICTDVAARGLDIKNVSHVYNYDIPNSPKEYIHRIGRTARAGKEGTAISLVSQNDYDNFRNVCEEHSLKVSFETLPELEPLQVSFQSHQRPRRDWKGGGRFNTSRDRFRSGQRSTRGRNFQRNNSSNRQRGSSFRGSSRRRRF